METQNLDLCVTWTKHADYPVFRNWLSQWRFKFNKIIIYFSEHNRFPYFDHFIQTALIEDEQALGENLGYTFFDPILTDWSKEDWRNKATNEMLKHSTSEWVCSIEQDWFSRDWPKLFELIEQNMQTADMFGWLNPTTKPYIHPAFWFIKRELLEKIGKDFSPHPEIPGSDHFAMITYKAQELGVNIGQLLVGEVKPDTLAFHLGGVNQNYLDGINNNYFHRSEIFYVYNYWCRKANVIQSPLFTDISLKIEEKLRAMFPDVNPETSPWSKFFI